MGYSLFPNEVSFMPKAWAEAVYPNLKFYRTHEKVSEAIPTRFFDVENANITPKGGHFAALEQPELFLEDVEEFFKLVRATSKI